MARFKVRDLMIQLPEEGERGPAAQWYQCKFAGYGLAPSQCGDPSLCPLDTYQLCILNTCPRLTCVWHTFPFGPICPGVTPCLPQTKIYQYSPVCKEPETPVQEIAQNLGIDPAVAQQLDLDTLRTQLQQALDQVEAQVRVRDEQLTPKTVEEFEQLEQRLTEALEELKARKARLQD